MSGCWFLLQLLLDLSLKNQVWIQEGIKLQVWWLSWVWSQCVVWRLLTRGARQRSSWKEGAWLRLLCCKDVHHLLFPLQR